MSEVTLQIDGKHYTLACAPGEEAQVLRLAGTIEAKLKQLGSNLSASPAQNLLFAALLLADELEETRSGSGEPAVHTSQAAEHGESKRQVEQLKLELEALRTEHDEAVRELAIARQLAEQRGTGDNADEFADLTEKMAEQLEAFATRLEAVGSAP
ncbi:MAG: cell division protein ZapA [Alphaproteobacteria bacterium]|nr:MAG: cell division protein ZapA [Alphaproteobacteria bacterium]